MITQKDLECEIKELQLEIKSGKTTISTLQRILEKKEQQLKEMNDTQRNWKVETMNANYPMLEVIDENTVKIDGVKYQKIGTPRPKTLYDALKEKHGDYPMGRIDVCNIVRGWLIDHTTIETEDAEMVTFTIHKEQLQTPK